MRIVYLNGEYLPLSEARVSVLDRGFTFADGVYEVIPVFSGNIFRMDEHLVRLSNSLESIDMELPAPVPELNGILRQIVQKNPATGDQLIYMQVTRGVDDREHVYGGNITPTLFVMCKPVKVQDFSRGVKVITHEDIRWKYCHIKSIALLPNVMLKKAAKDKESCHEAILIRDGMVTEGAASNVFIVSNGVVRTPMKDSNVLPGITRDLVVELLLGAAMDCTEADISERELKDADEVWITSSTMGLVPVVNIDGNNVGDGKPGPVWKQANELYESYKINASQVIEQPDCVA